MLIVITMRRHAAGFNPHCGLPVTGWGAGACGSALLILPAQMWVFPSLMVGALFLSVKRED